MRPRRAACSAKAFDSAEETVVHFVYHTLLFQHLVIIKVVLAALLAGFVLPAWMRYIVPAGMKTRDDHLKEVKAQRERGQHFASGDTGHLHGGEDDVETSGSVGTGSDSE